MPSMSSRSGSRRRSMNEINMVPFIDVMLVLLIIFMVTATVITPGAINVPSAGKSSKAPDDYLTVAIDAKGVLKSNGGKGTDMQEAGSEKELVANVEKVLAANPDLPVLVAGDKDLSYQQVVSVMGKLREAGVQRIALSVK